MTKNTFAVINFATSWNSPVPLTPECLDELNFWKDNFADVNAIPLWLVKRKPARTVNLDAFNSASGGYVQFEDKIFHQNWFRF